MEGFLYPNEGVIQWDLLIVIYPYITGLVAGAFIVSSLYHVFGIQQLKPVARFSLLTALAFLLVAPLPLLLHLGQTGRLFEMFLTPHLTSAMAGFGYIWLFYLILVLAEVWLVFRKDIVRYAQSSHGIKKFIYSLFALGVYDLSERALRTDERNIKVFSAIGIPAAVLLHGYVGFIFGAVKANPWWSTPLMPIIFLLSAIVSGIALLMLLYIVVTKIRKAPLDHKCLSSLGGWLLGFLLIDLVLGGLEVVSMMYESEESWEMISELITGKLGVSYLGIQLAIGALVPIVLLGVSRFVRLKPGSQTAIGLLSSALVLIGIFAMRWNVVIGGQLFSKSLRGFTSYVPELMGREGLLVAVALMILPFVILAIVSYFISPWREELREAP